MNPRTLLNRIVDRRTARRARTAAGKPGKRGLLLIASGGLGDAIILSVVIERFFRLVGPDEPVRLILRDNATAAGFLFPERVGIVPVDYRRFLRNPVYRARVSAEIAGWETRVAAVTDHLRLPTVSDVFVLASGAEERLGMTPKSWPKHDAALARNRAWYTRWTPVPDGMAHRAVRWVDLANALTGRDDPLPLVRFPEDRLPPAVKTDRPLAVIHPFSAQPERGPGVGLFGEILTALPPEFEVVLSAAPGDLERCPEFRVLLDDPRVRLDAGSLYDKAALLRATRLAVSVDTSLMHLAVGVGAPTLCLASAAHLVDSVPYDPRMTPDNAAFLYHDMPCRGCLGNCVHEYEDGRYPCVARLDPGQVTKTIHEILKTPERGDGAA